MNTEQIPTTEDSSTVEQTTFNLEWAKRGGVFVYKGVVDPIYTAKLIEVHKSGMLEIVFTNDFSHERCFKDDLRMATRAECDAADVEYIEPPVSAEELAELRKNKEMLEFILTHRLEVSDKNTRQYGRGWVVTDCKNKPWSFNRENPIDAITEAMRIHGAEQAAKQAESLANMKGSA